MILDPFTYNWLRVTVKMKALEARETCHHWINFEIYDSLSEDLQLKYLEQFDLPSFILRFGEIQLVVSCRANHLDSPSACRCDCSEKYPQTLKFIREEIMNDKPVPNNETTTGHVRE